MKRITKLNDVWMLVFGLCFLIAGSASAEPHYVGAKGCSGCHKAEYQDWQRSLHGKAWELLKPGNRSKAKHRAKLDPDKDYTVLANQPEKFQCFKCHTVGYKKPSGFVDLNTTPDLAGIGCESCHGPGSDFREIHKLKMLDFTVAETKAAGQTYASKGDKVCQNCHNEDSPMVPAVDKKYEFDLKERLSRKDLNEAFHQLYPLEGKHGE